MAKITYEPDTTVEYEDSDLRDEDVRPRKSNWLLPLLLVPIFFVLGWVANDFARTNPNAQNMQQQYGIGAGPDNQVWPSPTPMSWIPTDTPSVESPVITPSATGSSGVIDNTY